MVDIDNRRAGQLDINVMIVPLAGVTRRNYRMGIEIDPAHEGRSIVRTGIGKPGLLMLAKARTSSVPANLHAGTPFFEEFKVATRTPECVALEPLRLCIRSPENEPHVDASRGGTIENVQCGTLATGHGKICPHESYSHPDILPGGFNCLADPPKRRFAVNQRSHQIPCAHGIASRCHEGNGCCLHRSNVHGTHSPAGSGSYLRRGSNKPSRSGVMVSKRVIKASTSSSKWRLSMFIHPSISVCGP